MNCRERGCTCHKFIGSDECEFCGHERSSHGRGQRDLPSRTSNFKLPPAFDSPGDEVSPRSRPSNSRLPPAFSTTSPCNLPGCKELVPNEKKNLIVFCSQKHLDAYTNLPKCTLPTCQKKVFQVDSFCSPACDKAWQNLGPNCAYQGCKKKAQQNSTCCSKEHYRLFNKIPIDKGVPELEILNLTDPHCKDVVLQFQKKWTTGTPPNVLKVYRVHIAKTVSDAYFKYQKSIADKYPWMANTVKGPGNELRRFHGTTIQCNLANDKLCSSTSCPVCQIIKTGFQTKFAASGLLGPGTYFSSVSAKSHGYNSGSQNKIAPSTRCMFMCLVVAGDAHKVTVHQRFTTPPNNKDSVVFTGTYDELVVYKDGCAIPRYLIVYQS